MKSRHERLSSYQLRKTSIVFFVAVFLLFTGAGLVVPLLSMYAHRLGASGMSIGLMMGALPLAVILVVPLVAPLSDRLGRKPFIITGLLFYGCATLGFVFFEAILVFILLRFIHGVAVAICEPAAMAYTGELSLPGREGFMMGILSAMVVLGYSVGSFISGFIVDSLGVEMTFISMTALALGSALLGLLGMPPIAKEKLFPKRITSSGVMWGKILKNREMLLLVLLTVVFNFCSMGVIWTALPILADTLFGVSTKYIGILVSASILSSGVIFIPAGRLADRFNKKHLLLGGGLLVALSFLLMGHASSYWTMLAASFLFGGALGIAIPALRALMVLRGEKIGAMASTMGALVIGQYIGMMLGSLAAGIVMDVGQIEHIFYLSSALVFIVVISYGILTKRQQAGQ